MATIPPKEGDPTVGSALAMMKHAKPLDANGAPVADDDARLHQALQILARSLLRQAQQQLEQLPQEPDSSTEVDTDEDQDCQEPPA